MERNLQIKLVNHLRRCTFLPGSYDKRFVRSIASQLGANVKPLSQKQTTFLVNVFHRYRKQIGSAYETLCLELDPNAFDLVFDITGNASIVAKTKKGKPIVDITQ